MYGRFFQVCIKISIQWKEYENTMSHLHLTLIWVGFLRICSEVGGGRVKLPSVSKTR